MRTNIVLNDQLVTEAMQLVGVTTKREIVERALTEFVQQRKRLDPRALRGADLLREDYDYKALRTSAA